MTPFRARLTVFAVTALCLATATNALFLQDPQLLPSGLSNGPTTSVSITHFPKEKTQQDATPQPAAPVSMVPMPKPPENTPRLQTAVLRELTRKGYVKPSASQNASPDLRAIVLIYEFDSGLPLTGELTDFIFKRLIFDLSPAPRGAFADRAEADTRLVLDLQKSLLELGFFSGVLSGRMDVWTENAVKAFERHRGVAVTGRLTEKTLLELVNYSGQPLRRIAG